LDDSDIAAAAIGSTVQLRQRKPAMAKDDNTNDPREAPNVDPRQQSDWKTTKQTDQPWQGNPEKDQLAPDREIDLEKWQKSNTH
jgi:hypothetical protein